MGKSLKNFISGEIHIGLQDFINMKNIMLCVDSHYIKYIGVTINSIVILNPTERYAFHIFYDKLNDIDLEKLYKTNELYGCSINIYLFNTKAVSGLTTVVNSQSHVNVATLFRLIGFGVLPNEILKVLYFDSDILVNGNINEFWTNNMNGSIALVVEDVGNITHSKRINVQKYFNPGVMFVDLEKWNQLNLTEETINLLFDGSIWRFMDQDVLNVVLNGKVIFISPKYNYMYRLNHTINAVHLSGEVPVIYHFIGISKPWCEWTQEIDVINKYNNILKKTFWNDNTLTKASDINNQWVKYKVYQTIYRGAKKISSC